jgi:dTDP-4-amino-4,6-dideoxygalactose transaminase
LIALSVFLRPSLYGVPARLLKLGESRFDPNFPIQRYNPTLSRVGALLVSRIDEINAGRRRHAASLRALLPNDERILVPSDPQRGHAIYVRFPILIPNPALRERVFLRLRELGLGVSISYPASVPRIPGIRPYLASDTVCPGGDRVARSILTLPTHSLVEDRDLARISDAIEGCLK